MFKDLDIQNYQWEKYGDYLAGATRLWLYPEDLHKIGEVFLNNGLYQGRQIISRDWIDYMLSFTSLTKNVDTPDAIFRRYAYAKGIWLAKDNDIFFAHGTDGQTLVLIPKKKVIILTLAEQENVSEIEKIIDHIIRYEI